MDVLLIEDDGDLRRLLVQALAERGHRIHTFDRADLAQSICQQMYFPLILLDRMLPDIDGLAMCRWLRSLPWGPRAVILMVTERADEPDLQATLAAGADDIILRPVKLQFLLSRLTVAEAWVAAKTTRYLQEDEIRAAGARYHALLERTRAFSYVAALDQPGRFLRVSPQVESILGFPPDNWVQQRGFWWERIHPDDRDRVLTEIGRSHLTGQPLRAEYRMVTRWGEVRWFQDEAVVVTDAAGRPLHLQGELVDITERKSAQQAQAESEARFRRLAENAPDLIYRFDLRPEGHFSYVNPSAGPLTGYLPSEYYANPNLIVDICHPDDRSLLQPPHLARGRQPPSVFTVRLKHRAGHWVHLEFRRVSVFDERGQLIAVEGIARDVTERIQAQEALQASERRFRALIEHSFDALLLLSVAGVITYVGPSTARILGYDPDELLGRPAFRLIHPDDLLLHLELFGRLSNEPRLTLTGQFRVLCRDGAWRWVEAVGTNLLDEPAVHAIVIHGRDINDAREMSDQLQRAQRLEIAGRVAGQVAHDFNNLLGPLIGYPELIKMRLPAGHPAITFCDEMLAAAQRMAAINEDLQALSRRGYAEHGTVDLNRLVEQTLADLAPLPEGVEVVTDLVPDLLPVDGGASQLSRVIVNLVKNALDAMPGAGTLTVRTRNVYVDAPTGRTTRVGVGEYVLLTVSDTGSGIDPTIRDRIFDAFVTTKRSDRKRGAGLGLTVVQAIVEDHRGFVDVESEIGKGTTFKVYLPVQRGTESLVISLDLPTGTESILVVDDDEGQRALLAEMLESLGYSVAQAESGLAAIEYLRDHRVDLLILDMVMPPGMDGTDTFRAARELHPDQRAIILSGFAETERVRQARAMGAGAFLPKPITTERLARAVRAELDRPART